MGKLVAILENIVYNVSRIEGVLMKKLDNKGFAISTMLYGLLIVLILVITTLMGIMSFNRKNSKDFTDVIIDDLENQNSYINQGVNIDYSDSQEE